MSQGLRWEQRGTMHDGFRERGSCRREMWLEPRKMLVASFMGSAKKSELDSADSTLRSLLFWSWYVRRIELGTHQGARPLPDMVAEDQKGRTALGDSMKEEAVGLSA